MNRPLIKYGPLRSTFLSSEKDTETILRRLFVESQPYSDILKRLLVINTKDCLDNLDNQVYKDTLKNMTLKKMVDEGYIMLGPRTKLYEFENVKAFLFITFDNFMQISNPEFRDCDINFDIVCNNDYWDLGNYRQRPLKIAGYIDGIMNKSRLSGIGTLEFVSCGLITCGEDFSGYALKYRATHGSDDEIPFPDEDE